MTDDEQATAKVLLPLAHALLREYLEAFPEHDQGDFRVFQAAELLEQVVGETK